MIIKNAEHGEEGWSFDLSLTNEEVDYLVNHSIASLMDRGLINLLEQEEPQEFELPGVTHDGTSTLN